MNRSFVTLKVFKNAVQKPMSLATNEVGRR
jgi:hypothetical protein